MGYLYLFYVLWTKLKRVVSWQCPTLAAAVHSRRVYKPIGGGRAARRDYLLLVPGASWSIDLCGLQTG